MLEKPALLLATPKTVSQLQRLRQLAHFSLHTKQILVGFVLSFKSGTRPVSLFSLLITTAIGPIPHSPPNHAFNRCNCLVGAIIFSSWSLWSTFSRLIAQLTCRFDGACPFSVGLMSCTNKRRSITCIYAKSIDSHLSVVDNRVLSSR